MNKPIVTAATILAVLLAPTAVSAFDAGATAEAGCDRTGYAVLTNLTTQAFIDARPAETSWVHHYTIVGQGAGTADVGESVRIPVAAAPGDVLTVIVKWTDSAMSETLTVTVDGPTVEECAPPPPPAPTLPAPTVEVVPTIIPPAPAPPVPTLPVTGTGTASIAAAIGSVLVGAGTWMVRAAGGKG